MADAACAEEEESLKRAISVASQMLATIRRVESGEITVKRDAIETTKNDVVKALRLLISADMLLIDSITGCKGCHA